MSPDPSFTVHADADVLSESPLLMGFSAFGLAGLTAADYLVDQLDIDPVGHVAATGVHTIAPFENGTPRHHTRLFGGDAPISVLVSEMLAPPTAAQPLTDSLLTFFDDAGGSEVAILSGVPTAHGPDSHRTFYIATQDYQQQRLETTDVPPMGGGFLEGVNAAFIERAMGSPLAACVYSTPVHMQAPDISAAIRLVNTVDDVYDLGIDTAPLEKFAAELSKHYEELAAQVQQQREEEYPPADDRMYM